MRSLDVVKTELDACEAQFHRMAERVEARLSLEVFYIGRDACDDMQRVVLKERAENLREQWTKYRSPSGDEFDRPKVSPALAEILDNYSEVEKACVRLQAEYFAILNKDL